MLKELSNLFFKQYTKICEIKQYNRIYAVATNKPEKANIIIKLANITTIDILLLYFIDNTLIIPGIIIRLIGIRKGIYTPINTKNIIVADNIPICYGLLLLFIIPPFQMIV